MRIRHLDRDKTHGRALRFLLVPDSSAARRVRRLIAKRHACSGVVVGTWPELVEWAQRAYLALKPVADWERTFLCALEKFDGVFWCESLSVAPIETREAVESALVQVISTADLTGGVDTQRLDGLPERLRRHLADLLRLRDSLAGRLPDGLAAIQYLLKSDVSDALYTIRIHHVEGVPDLTRWQVALVRKLNRDADGEIGDGVSDEELANILRSVLAENVANAEHSALGVLQLRVFATTDDKAELDESVQWVGVRDYLQEAEVAAGMVQTLLANHSELKAADIGVLIPDRLEYALAVEDAFRLAGLALSGLPAERWRRDLGSEALLHFLYCRQKPAPAMALAVCLSSPLMPWSRKEGIKLAQAVMDGDYRLRPMASAGSEARAMLDLLRHGDSEPRTLAQALRQFLALLDCNDELASHVQQARAAVEKLSAALATAVEIDWASLRRAVCSRLITLGESPHFNLEGVTVWREAHEAWRSVRRLIVLGFAQGHYPAALRASSVFSADDILAIREHIGLAVSTPSEALAHRRLRFRRQLGAVSEAVTFLIPRRDANGEVQAPSESLVFMHQLFVGPESVDELIVELDAADQRARIRHLALAEPEPPRPPRILRTEDMHFDCDLLSLHADADGRLKPESPSSLETLMISRLAWLLRLLDAEPLRWAPESADASLLGTLAHEAFEGLFRPGEKLPKREEIPALVEALLDEAMLQRAPFLMTPQWQVEKRHLAVETAKAAQVWRDVLARLGAEVLASEAWLQGNWSGIPIHGQADQILNLPENRLLVVDYKRSKSKNRRPRMIKGYDSQASLYRAMLQSGGPKDNQDEALVTRLRMATCTGIVYYMLHDQISLSDVMLPESGAIPGWQALENDIANRAMVLIQRRLAEVREGRLCLNRDGDAEYFEKQVGVKPYVLKNSPLIDLFTVPGEAVEVQ